MTQTSRPRGREAATPYPNRFGFRRRRLSVPLGVLLLALACGDGGEQRARDSGREPQARTEGAALTTTPGTPNHDIYAAKGFTCVTCHPCGTRSTDGHQVSWMDPASAQFHASSANQNIAGCQTCHGPALDGVGGTTSVSCAQCHGATWKTNCTMCHGGTDNATGAPPEATWGNSADAVRVGAHTSHVAATHALSQAVGCAVCHPMPTDALTGGHLDGTTAAVTFAGLASHLVAGPGPTWNRAQATCSTTYCHGATLAGGTTKSPSWTVTDGSARACNSCHGAPPPAPHVQNTQCGSCHQGYTALTVNPTLHVDGTVNVRTDIGCATCHGSVANAAPPAGTAGETLTTQRAVGAHQRHLAGGVIKGPIACTECHLVPTTNDHADGPVQLAWGPLASARGALPAFYPDLTCSNYCHGQTLAAGGLNTMPIWTRVDGTQAVCGTCHGAPPPPHPSNPWCDLCHTGYSATGVNLATHVDGKLDVVSLTCSSCHGTAQNPAPPSGTGGETLTTDIAVGAHQQHLAGGTLSSAIACDECHVVPPATATDHADAIVAVTWGPLAAASGAVPDWDRATATCSATYCHGQFTGGNLLNSPSWITVDGSQDACGTCHGAPPPAPHPDNAECERCHAGYTASSVQIATHVDGQVEVDLSCNSCHGSDLNAAPPMGTHGEALETSRAVGAHQRHLAGGPLRGPMGCDECHLVPTVMDHKDGSVQVTFGTLAWAEGATPTWDPATLTCSGTYCHGAQLRGGGLNQSPGWTGGPSETTCGTCHTTPPPEPHPHTQVCDNCHPGYTMTSVNLTTHVNGLVEAENLTCSSCHGDDSRVLVSQADPLAIAAPPFGSRGETETTSRSVGQHQAHVSRGDGIALPNKCRYCHAVPTTFDHANGVPQVTFGSLATMDGATPTFEEATSTCSNTYCHGSTLGRGGTDHDPSWTNPTPVTCTTCHGAPPPLPHAQDTDCIRCHPGYTQTTVRKWTHVNGVSDFPSGCNACHDTPPNSGAHYEHLHERVTCDRCHQGYTATSANPVLHRNAVQNVTLAGWNPTTRTCSNIGCHGSEYWGRTGTAAKQSCNQCHGVPPASGEHYEHKEYSCSRCHGTGYSTTTNNPATHMNGVTDMAVPFYDRTTHSCSWGTGACHGSESWGAPRPVAPNCDNCHGFPPPLPHPQQSACQSCHPSMLSTGVLTTDHNNGTLDISGAGCASCHGFPPAVTRAGGSHPGDANCYGCHSTTVDASNQIVPNGTHNDGYVQVGGGGVGTYGCQSCHGDQARQAPAGADANVKAAPPLGTRGEIDTTARAVGAHLAHVSPALGTLAGPALCSECHPVPTAMDHANGQVVIAFGGRATLGGTTPAYDPVSVSCSRTYCHGNFVGGNPLNAPTWTNGAGEAACGTCHGAPPPAPHAANANCGGCHEGYTLTSVNLATHVDGVVQSSSHPDGYAAANQHGRDANLQGLSGCATCHGADLNGGSVGVSCNACHATAGFSTWATDCTFCHGDPGTGRQSPPVDIQGRNLATNVSVGTHASHVGTTIATPIACGQCHPARTASVITDAAHIDGDGIAEVAFGPIATIGGAPATYTRVSDTSATCASTYCHGAFGGGANATMDWTSTVQVGCTSCHGAPPPAPHTTITSCGTCHQGYTQTTVNAATHVDGILQVTSSHAVGYASATSHGTDANLQGLTGCKSCHGADLNGASGPSCTTCHATAGFASWATNCTFCHGSRTTGGAHPPQDIRNGTATTSVTVGVHENHMTSAIANVACTECHPARTESVVTDSAHMDGNGLAEIAFGTIARTGNVTPTYTRVSGTSATCASTYCHGKFTGGANNGQGATVNWTSTTQVGCTSCHGRPPSTGRHDKHSSRSCGDCHGVGYTTSAVVKATHVDGIEQVGNRVTSYNRTTRSCTSTCHGSETW